jgi:CHAT domain-containing protein/ribosomal protein L18
MSIRVSLYCACFSILGVILLSPILALNPVSESIFSAQAAPNSKDVADRLNQEGLRALKVSQYPVALEKFQSALNIYMQIGDRNGEGRTLSNIGSVYKELGQYKKALENYQKALVVSREIGYRALEGATLDSIGLTYDSLGQYAKALENYQQSLGISKGIGDRAGEGTTINNIGAVYNNLGQYPKALEAYQQFLLTSKEISNLAGEGTALNNIGAVYNNLGQYPKALENYQKALVIHKEIGDRAREGTALNNIGAVYNDLGQYPKALENYQKALVIRKDIGDRAGEGTTLNNIGAVYDNLGQYPKALETFQKSLVISKEIGNRAREGTTFNNIGSVYNNLGQYKKALENYQKALVIRKEIGDRAGEGVTFNNIGLVYIRLGQYAKALETSQQSLVISKEIGNRTLEGRTLNNIGAVYEELGQYPKALETFQKALVIHKEIGDLTGEGTALNNIGAVYKELGQYPKALENYQKALVISKEIGNRAEEGMNLGNIGEIYVAQKQSASAISFLKQAVTAFELIRQDNRPLSRDQQESYTKMVEPTYRELADLLLSQGRLLEAQQVLELLKIQEIYSVDRENRATLASSGIEYTPTENKIKTQHGSLIALGQKLYTCETISNCSDVQRIQWRSQREALQKQFDQSLDDAEKKAKIRISQSSISGKDDFIKSYQGLVEAQPGTLFVYPFVTEDKIWLLWASAGGVLGSTEVPHVGRIQLLKAVQEFRGRLQTPTSDPSELAKLQQSGQKLYQWLIKPLEPALTSKTIKHLVFSLDSATRYIPMSALVDSDKKYLMERYTISTVLSASLTDTSDRLPKSTQNTSVLGLGVSLGFPPEFKALQNVEPELKAIVQAPGDTTGLYPGEKILNAGFSQQTFADRLRRQNILHIATHAKFLSANPKESYLLLGNGEKYPIRNIQFLRNLKKVQLVVLSACETGLGETDADGKEILGISAYFTGGSDKAKAVLASLWAVNDTSTSDLMQRFYQNLSKGTMTKSEALQQAQLSMIQNTSPQNYSHPYYWAPFILIGNGF